MQEVIPVSESLWLVLNAVSPEYDDGLFYLRDDVGGEVLIDRDALPQLLEALQQIRERVKQESEQ